MICNWFSVEFWTLHLTFVCFILAELQPRVKGWLLGSVDGKNVGLVPANYVKVLGKRRGTKTSDYPVRNQLNDFERNGDVQTGQTNQAGLNEVGSVETLSNANTGTSLVQSPSAMNFESQAQRGFSDSASNMDSVFQNELNPLDSVPDLNSDRNENS